MIKQNLLTVLLMWRQRKLTVVLSPSSGAIPSLETHPSLTMLSNIRRTVHWYLVYPMTLLLIPEFTRNFWTENQRHTLSGDYILPHPISSEYTPEMLSASVAFLVSQFYSRLDSPPVSVLLSLSRQNKKPLPLLLAKSKRLGSHQLPSW